MNESINQSVTQSSNQSLHRSIDAFMSRVVNHFVDAIGYGTQVESGHLIKIHFFAPFLDASLVIKRHCVTCGNNKWTMSHKV